MCLSNLQDKHGATRIQSLVILQCPYVCSKFVLLTRQKPHSPTLFTSSIRRLLRVGARWEGREAVVIIVVTGLE
jgi:hypothetical protein